MQEPKSDFEKKILSNYNRCRTEALYKYFPTLGKSNISTLMKDNYLKKNDLRHFFQ